MRKMFFILAVIVSSSVFSKDNPDTPSVNILGHWASLSKDKSKAYIMSRVEKKLVRKTKYEKCFSAIYEITNDTIEVFEVIREARPRITDSIVLNLYLKKSVFSLEDSTLPRWSHLFGQDTCIERCFSIYGGYIDFEEKVVVKESKISKYLGNVYLMAFGLLLYVFICMLNNRNTVVFIRYTLFFIFGLTAYIFSTFKGNATDLIIMDFIVLAPPFILTMFFPKKTKIDKKIEYLQELGYLMGRPVGEVELGVETKKTIEVFISRDQAYLMWVDKKYDVFCKTECKVVDKRIVTTYQDKFCYFENCDLKEI